MAKIKLGARPASFKRVVTFPMLDGSEGTIEVSYKYRTRKEFGAFIDGVIECAGMSQPVADEKFSMEALMSRTSGANADYVLEVADGWNLDESFTIDTVRQLADELPAAVTAIMETYRAACVEGRLGN